LGYHQAPLLAVAGAGSSKTRVFIHLIGEHGADLGQTLAVTCSNKADRQKKGRLEPLLSQKLSQRKPVRTALMHPSCGGAEAAVLKDRKRVDLEAVDRHVPRPVRRNAPLRHR
jgi:superfamily I DNA/RNA helicase